MRKCLLFVLTSIITTSALQAHTLFVKPDEFRFEPQRETLIPLINGTFFVNEKTVSSKSIAGVDVVGPQGVRLPLPEAPWREEGEAIRFNFKAATAGNYVIGVSTKPRKVRLSADEFNYYLRYEGLFDNARLRRERGEVAMAVVERYTKFAKTIIQAGDDQTPNYSASLGHRVEIIPLSNPFALSENDVFRARLLRDGQPLMNHLVYATHEGYYPTDSEGINDELVKTRSNDKGEIEFQLSATGRWYVRFIDLQQLIGESEYWYSDLLVWLKLEEPALLYESNWATLTFEVR